MIRRVGESLGPRVRPLRPLSLLAWGLLLAVADVRVNGVDLLPDVVGWGMGMVAALVLGPWDRAFAVAGLGCGLGLLASVLELLGARGAPTSTATSVAETLAVFGSCTAVMRLVPERRATANALRWWELGLTLAFLLLVTLTAENHDFGLPALLVGLAALVVLVCVIVLLFRAARTEPPRGKKSPKLV